MLLTVDIGNTTISLAVMKAKKVKKVFILETAWEEAVLKNRLRNLCKGIKRGYKFKAVVICSVVPRALKIVKPVISAELKITSYIIGNDLIVPLRNRYKNPKQVGQDRLVCAYAAMRLYGCPIIIIDLGTAITMDVVSKNKEYLGGIIIPGIRLSIESLYRKTALLPKVSVSIPKTLIGRDTKTSILSGIFYGYGSMCSGLIKKIIEEMKENSKVIMTGGHTQLMKKFIQGKSRIINQNLVFEGMSLLYEDVKN